MAERLNHQISDQHKSTKKSQDRIGQDRVEQDSCRIRKSRVELGG